MATSRPDMLNILFCSHYTSHQQREPWLLCSVGKFKHLDAANFSPPFLLSRLQKLKRNIRQFAKTIWSVHKSGPPIGRKGQKSRAQSLRTCRTVQKGNCASGFHQAASPISSGVVQGSVAIQVGGAASCGGRLHGSLPQDSSKGGPPLGVQCE